MTSVKPERPEMTVGQLLAMLAAFPAELPVMVDGYEAGVQAPVAPRLVTVDRLEWGGGMFGDYEVAVGPVAGKPIVYLSRNHPRDTPRSGQDLR